MKTINSRIDALAWQRNEGGKTAETRMLHDRSHSIIPEIAPPAAIEVRFVLESGAAKD